MRNFTKYMFAKFFSQKCEFQKYFLEKNSAKTISVKAATINCAKKLVEFSHYFFREIFALFLAHFFAKEIEAKFCEQTKCKKLLTFSRRNANIFAKWFFIFSANPIHDGVKLWYFKLWFNQINSLKYQWCKPYQLAKY